MIRLFSAQQCEEAAVIEFLLGAEDGGLVCKCPATMHDLVGGHHSSVAVRTPVSCAIHPHVNAFEEVSAQGLHPFPGIRMASGSARACCWVGFSYWPQPWTPGELNCYGTPASIRSRLPLPAEPGFLPLKRPRQSLAQVLRQKRPRLLFTESLCQLAPSRGWPRLDCSSATQIGLLG